MEKQPIKITLWQCPTCGTQYDNLSAAERCTNNPARPPKFEVGDKAYALCRYPRDPSRPYAQRTIIKVLPPDDPSHSYRYGVDRTVQVGKTRYLIVQKKTGWNENSCYVVGDDEDLLKIGELGCLNGYDTIVSLLLVNFEE